MSTRLAVIETRFANRRLQYSTWGHVVQLAKAELKGIEAAGGKADIYQ